MVVNAAPVAPAERVEAIDVIRGFALLGILIMNLPFFGVSFYADADGTHFFNADYDRFASNARDLLFSGKFNSMFSFLFAVGFTIQWQRLRQRSPGGAYSIYARRLLVLLAFGLGHAFLIWTGDVLHVYAVLGLVLVLCLWRLPDVWIWILIMACTLAPTLITWWRLPVLTPAYMEQQISIYQAFEAADNLAYGSGSLLDAIRQNVKGMIISYADPESRLGYLRFYLALAATMMLGLLAGRHRLIQRAAELQTQIRRALWWLAGVGLVTGAIYVYCYDVDDVRTVTINDFVGGFAYRSCRLALMCFYVGLILVLLRHAPWRERFSGIALAGRAPLTNYLMQSVICVVLFYHWGFGLWQKVGPALSLLLAFVIFFGVQVPLSRWWFRRRSFGPMEQLWRLLSYGRRPGASPAAAGTPVADRTH